MSFPTTCPKCGADLLPRNPGWAKLVECYTKAHKAGRVSTKSILHVPEEIEEQLFALHTWEVGEQLVAKIMSSGVRGAFLTMFGLQIRWGAQKLEITDAAIVP